MEERLQKLIANAGLCSRRAAEELLVKGRVLVNGVPAALGQKADPERDLFMDYLQYLDSHEYLEYEEYQQLRLGGSAHLRVGGHGVQRASRRPAERSRKTSRAAESPSSTSAATATRGR